MVGMNSDQSSPRQTGSSPDSSDETARRRRRGMLGILTLALLVAWLLMAAPLPYSLGSGLAGLVALVVLIPLIVQTFRIGRHGMAVFTAVIGIPATLLIMMSSALTLLFYGPMSDLEDCRRTAITERAQAQCAQEMQEAGVEWISDLLGG